MEGGKQIIEKKQQAVTSDHRKKNSSHLEKKTKQNHTHVGSFELLKQIVEVVTEQTVCLEK